MNQSVYKRWHLWAILGLLVFGLCTKLYRLDYPKSFYFDETYHGFTATRFLHGDSNVFDPWVKQPHGTAYEWTHPPLAKLLMATSMQIVGENSFGWRLGSVAFGTLAIALAGWLAFELFHSTRVSLLTVFYLTFEGLVFAQSRIAMNDIYFVCFALAAFIFYVRWRRNPKAIAPLLLTGVGLGLALACKWTGLYLFLIIAIDLGGGFLWTNRFPGNRLPWKEALAWSVIPGVVYLGSYYRLFTLGGTWNSFVELQKQMWYYHNGLTSTHSYSSVPWQWLLNVRPVWMHVDYSTPGKLRNIYNIGNSLILIFGLVGFVRIIFDKKRRWTWELYFIALCYLMLWLPWSFSPRIMLFYHYLPAVPFLCVFLALWTDQFLQSRERRQRLFGMGILASSALWFFLFFPHMTGLAVTRGFADAVYFMVPGWR
jgi:dolichyl-phosphate-mannose--protein O-mannosyl transferase